MSKYTRNPNGAYKTDTAVTILGILDKTETELAERDELTTSGYHTLAMEHHLKAQSLIELLETHLYGKTGGLKLENKFNSLDTRFDQLKKHYHTLIP